LELAKFRLNPVRSMIDRSLGFYEAGDQILGWLNSLDTEHMTMQQLRSELVHKILIMRPINGSRAATRSQEDILHSSR